MMTTRSLETGYLSLRAWLIKCLLPSALTLFGLMIALYAIMPDERYRDRLAIIFGFFMLYYVLVRGGHMLMIRSMHFDLKKTYNAAYEVELQRLTRHQAKRNLGFSLTRIKRRLIDSQNKI